MWVGEAACTAFSTRFRQLLLNNRTEAHRPRTQFVQDSQLVTALDAPVQWPSRPQAMLLVETTLSTVGKCYYLSTCSSMRTMVERAYRDTTSLDALSMCKLFTIFALGEIHSSRLSMRDNIPAGLLYFAKATKLLRVIPERPRIEHIELLILFVRIIRFFQMCDELTKPVSLFAGCEPPAFSISIYGIGHAIGLDHWLASEHQRIGLT